MNELKVWKKGWRKKEGKKENELNARDKNIICEVLTFLGMLFTATVHYGNLYI
jgi:hypothetical protein